MAMILAAEVLLSMRVWALWDRALWVPCLFILMLSTEIGISIWALSASQLTGISPNLRQLIR